MPTYALLGGVLALLLAGTGCTAGRLHATSPGRVADDAEARLERALAGPEEGDREAARMDLAEPHYIKAFLLGGREQAGEALAHALRATELEPRRGHYWQLLGTLHFQRNEPEEARAALDKTVELEPGNVRALVLAGLLAMEQGRPAEALLLLRQAGKVDKDYFVREQFQDGDRTVMVVENFELEGEWARRYELQVYAPGQERPELVVSLGSYAYTNVLAREKDPEGPRVFHLDGYHPDGSHDTYGFFSGEPGYDETREMFISILKGGLQPMSSTKKKQP